MFNALVGAAIFGKLRRSVLRGQRHRAPSLRLRAATAPEVAAAAAAERTLPIQQSRHRRSTTS